MFYNGRIPGKLRLCIFENFDSPRSIFVCQIANSRWLTFCEHFLSFTLDEMFSFFFQIVILVVDSTDRERLSITKEELACMLANEVKHSNFCCHLLGFREE